MSFPRVPRGEFAAAAPAGSPLVVALGSRRSMPTPDEPTRAQDPGGCCATRAAHCATHSSLDRVAMAYGSHCRRPVCDLIVPLMHRSAQVRSSMHFLRPACSFVVRAMAGAVDPALVSLSPSPSPSPPSSGRSRAGGDRVGTLDTLPRAGAGGLRTPHLLRLPHSLTSHTYFGFGR